MNGSKRILGGITFAVAATMLLAAAAATAAVPDQQDAQPLAGAPDAHANTGDTGVVHDQPVLPTGTDPAEIVTGPDGNLWFTGFGNGTIGRSRTDGTTVEFPTPSGTTSNPDGIAVGPDGSLWFAETGSSRIGRTTLDGTITESAQTPTAKSGPAEIATGPDGALWFTERFGHRIGRLAPDGTITEYKLPTAANQPLGITLGPDGNLWFTEAPGNRIGVITPAGDISEPLSLVLPHPQSQPWEITTGPDGNLWFAERLGNRIGRVSIDGALTEFDVPTPKALPNTIRPGPDPNAARDCRVERRTLGQAAFELKYGAANAFGVCVSEHATTHSLWFTEEGGKVGEITTDGRITEFAASMSTAQPLGVTEGPDGNVWFTEFNANELASLRVDDVGPR